MLKVKIIWGSLREKTLGAPVARLALEIAGKQPDWDVEYIDLAERNLPFTLGWPTPSQANGQYSDPVVQAWSHTIKEADAFIVIAQEYNHGYAPVLKNALDQLYPEWNRKPVAFVGYGAQVGGNRAIEQLRQVVNELQMAPVREAVTINRIWEAFDENGKPTDPEVEPKMESMYRELSWWGNALKAAREKSE